MKDKYGNKIGICACGCTKEEKPLYAKGLLQGCYWKSRRKIAESKERKPREIKTYRINKVSKSMAIKLAEYRPIRDKYMKDNPYCEFKGCNQLGEQLHHQKPRDLNLCNVDIFMSVCANHHTWIHDNDKKSRELGYLK